MPKKLRGIHSRQFHKNAAVSPAPFLHKETVTLEDILTLGGDDNGGNAYALLNPDGVTD
jgi:hypothetical protein